MVKILMIIFLLLGLVVGSAFSNEPYDEGPTVIIVGPERDGQETSYDQQTENGDQYLIQENDQGEESPDAMGTEGEFQDQQEMPLDQQNTQEDQQEMPFEHQNTQEDHQDTESSE
jgi:hypothetical protein